MICGTYATKYCADAKGVSVKATERYLVEAAATRLRQSIGGDSFDATTFVLSNGIACRVQERACFKGKHGKATGPDVTKRLFP